MKKWVQLVITVVILVAADQLTKYWASTSLIHQAIELIPGVFEFHYVENRGAAFGILQNQQWFFIIGTIIMMFVLVSMYRKFPLEKRCFWLRVSCMMIISGAIGNLIDRVKMQYVVDFLYFKLIDFPVFNVADCYVVVGVGILILVFFLQKEMTDELIFAEEKSK